MTILRSFSRSESAHAAATFLRSREIEAVVIDDNAFGGNILGAMKNAIRIEVPEEQVEEAKRLLEEWYAE